MTVSQIAYQADTDICALPIKYSTMPIDLATQQLSAPAVSVVSKPMRRSSSGWLAMQRPILVWLGRDRSMKPLGTLLNYLQWYKMIQDCVSDQSLKRTQLFCLYRILKNILQKESKGVLVFSVSVSREEIISQNLEEKLW